MPKLTFITGNENKVRILQAQLGIEVAHHKLDLDEIQGLDLHKVIGHKALEAYRVLGAPVLVEDNSLEFKALGRLPGPLIKWFEEEIGYDGLCGLLAGRTDRRAIGRMAYGIYDGRDLQVIEGEMHGTISDAPRGDKGFGWDKIFINDGFTVTRSEMPDDDYVRTSMRTAAIGSLKAWLEARPEWPDR
jgi:non-canonical purine NTP pyrophosphatase (RdgB/HAM1 family)